LALSCATVSRGNRYTNSFVLNKRFAANVSRYIEAEYACATATIDSYPFVHCNHSANLVCLNEFSTDFRDEIFEKRRIGNAIWWWYGIGSLSLATAGYLFVNLDDFSSRPNSAGSKYIDAEPSDRQNAIGYGAAFSIVGAGALTYAVIQSIRARDDKISVSTRTEVVYEHKPCGFASGALGPGNRVYVKVGGHDYDAIVVDNLADSSFDMPLDGLYDALSIDDILANDYLTLVIHRPTTATTQEFNRSISIDISRFKRFYIYRKLNTLLAARNIKGIDNIYSYNALTPSTDLSIELMAYDVLDSQLASQGKSLETLGAYIANCTRCDKIGLFQKEIDEPQYRAYTLSHNYVHLMHLIANKYDSLLGDIDNCIEDTDGCSDDRIYNIYDEAKRADIGEIYLRVAVLLERGHFYIAAHNSYMYSLSRGGAGRGEAIEAKVRQIAPAVSKEERVNESVWCSGNADCRFAEMVKQVAGAVIPILEDPTTQALASKLMEYNVKYGAIRCKVSVNENGHSISGYVIGNRVYAKEFGVDPVIGELSGDMLRNGEGKTIGHIRGNKIEGEVYGPNRDIATIYDDRVDVEQYGVNQVVHYDKSCGNIGAATVIVLIQYKRNRIN